MNFRYRCLQAASGMDTFEASTFLGVDEDAIMMWVSGDEEADEDSIEKMAELICKMVTSVGETLDYLLNQMEENDSAPAFLEMGLASDDAEAELLGWPCVRVHEMVLGMMAAQATEIGIPISIVPRGSTLSSAAAADAFEEGLPKND